MSSPAKVRMSSEERREQLITEAIAEFAVGGYMGTATEAIARRMGVSQPYLFRLYKTKKAIFLAAAERAFDIVEQTFRDNAVGDTEEERLAAIGDAYIALLADRQLLTFQLHVYAAASLDEEIRDLSRVRFQRLFDLVHELTGADPDAQSKFMADGMLLNVASALDLNLPD
ncbi:TetR/AcrR family transcriptional regulator [Nocardia sp. NPDC004604]|uniref:TetR/AcrR family transcriptional regulator n=1 Tax=Nocardia sp. NPDC004604 TaxID=3157013 RepID=UPI0033A71C54